MANGGYVAQYGPSIRRLAALDLAASGNPDLAGAGPQPGAGLPDITPQIQPRGEGVLPPEAAQPQQGVLSQPPPNPYGEDAAPHSIYANMSKDERKNFVASAEKSGINIAERYDQMVKDGQIVPPERYMNKGEKLTSMAEVMLRHARNVGAGMTGPAASANAILETDQRRSGQLQAMEAARAQQIETLRQEERGDSAKRQERIDKIDDETRRQRNAEKGDLRAREFEREKERGRQKFESGENDKTRSAQIALEKQRGVQDERFTDSDGRVWVREKGSSTATPVEGDVEVDAETPGFRGRPPLKGKSKVRQQLKGLPGGSNANGLDQDKVVQAKIEAEKMVRNEDAQRLIQREARQRGIDPEVLTQQKIEEMKQRILGSQGGAAGTPVGDDVFGLR